MNAFTSTLPTTVLEYKAFAKAITNVCKVTGKNNTIPVLDCARITAVKGGVNISGTDLDTLTTTFVPGQVADGLDVVVSAHRLKAVLDKAKASTLVTFAKDGDRLRTSIGKLNLTIDLTEKPSDFPDDTPWIANVRTSGRSFLMPSAKLLDIIERIKLSISTEETRYYLNGLFMVYEEHKNELAFVTTDGHKLSRYGIAPPAGSGSIPSVIIPRALALELHRLLSCKGCPAETLVTVSEDGKAISFKIGETETLEGKVIDGIFPDYWRVIPQNNHIRAVGIISELIDGIKQASAVFEPGQASMKLVGTETQLSFIANSVGFGAGQIDVEIKATEGFEIGLNYKYLLAILGQISGGTEMHVADNLTPILFKDKGCPEILYLQMPLRV